MKSQMNKKIIVIILAALSFTACQKASEDAFKGFAIPADTAQPADTTTSQVEFKEWESLAKQYRLVEFDGKTVNTVYTEVKLSRSHFYDRTNQRYVDSVMFPFYYSVSASSEASYNFGILKDKGISTLTKSKDAVTQKEVRVYTYDFNESTNLQGYDIELHLSMTIIEDDRSLLITYSVFAPGQVQQTNHTFKLLKN